MCMCLACEAASCCASATCSCLGKTSSCAAIAGRVVYTVLFLFTSLVAWVFRGWGSEFLSWVPELKNCPEEKCYGALSVFRICFALTVFHLLMAVATIGVRDKRDCRVAFQDGWWFIKVPLVILLAIGCFFIPNAVFQYYGYIAIGGSVIFILVQLVWLVDFAHDFAATLLHKWEETESKLYYFALLGSSGLFYLAAIAATIAMYALFCSDATKCALNISSITINAFAVIILSVASIHPKVQEYNPSSGILQASLVGAYTTYLIWSSIMSEPADMGCNPWKDDNTTTGGVSLLIGVVFTILAVCYSTFRTASKAGEYEPLKEEEGAKDEEEGEEKSEKKKEGGPVTYNFSVFHLIFALGAMYIATLMTDWEVVDHSSKGTLQVDTGMASVWVKIVSSWLSLLFYAWTLFAPVMFPDRDFGYKKDFDF